MHVVSIDKQDVNQMPHVAFPGRIHVITSIPQVKSAVAALRTSPIAGFDTETRPCFKRGERHSVALLQLSTDTDAFLIRLNKTGITTPLKQYGITDMSLQKIYAILFQQKISKNQQLTNWEASQLSDAQQRYAAIDAWACLRIYERLQSGAFVPEQSPYWHELVEEI